MQKRDIVWIAFLILLGMWIGYQFLAHWKEKECIVMAGSVAMETFAEALTEKAGEAGITVKPEFIGSSAGIEALLKGTTQVAMVSRYLTKEEKNRGAEEHIVAYDGIVVVVNAENTVSNLSKEQLSDIFTGKIKNWKELGGIDEPVVVIGRELGSGTRDAFEKLLSIEGKTVHANECDSIGVVKMKVELLRGAIGYVSLEVIEEEDSKVKVVAIDHVKPNAWSIGKGEYILVRPFILATSTERNEQKELVRKLFLLLESRQGDIVFERAGVAAAKKTASQ